MLLLAMDRKFNNARIWNLLVHACSQGIDIFFLILNWCLTWP